jgi:CBS domain-containing protein
MKAADVMVSNVITIGVNASIGEVAAILLNNHISAAPVIGEKGELVGIVSEGDLLRRAEIGTTKRHSCGLSSFRMNGRLLTSTSSPIPARLPM